ncbi:MAG: N-acetylmuramoyl-L-alanine amidase [Kordiimonadaceae bacterium]|nr:N-acetylmuramoyl-L-alanine amidase [Kordiimonadaceae bacterium]
MKTGAEAIARLCDADAQVSAHYVVEEDGRVYQLVSEEKRAWHAGISHWQGRDNINDCSIGIELVNPGAEFGYCAFPAPQINELITLLSGIKKRHGIPAARFIGHSDIAPLRKIDPGELFPWRELADYGLGVISNRPCLNHSIIARKGDVGDVVCGLNKLLGIVGYHKLDGGNFGPGTEETLRAFQMHWRPEHVTGELDIGTQSVLSDIAEQLSS